MTLLFAFIWTHPLPALVGYWVGAAMHLVCDMLVNGEAGLKSPVLFYIFSYRVSHSFSAQHLLKNVVVPAEAGSRPVKDFFLRWLPRKPEAESLQSASASLAEEEG